MSSEALHLAGFAVGIPVGLYMLTRGYVDCEGFDIISHFQDQKGRDSKVGKKHLESRQRSKVKKQKRAHQSRTTDA